MHPTSGSLPPVRIGAGRPRGRCSSGFRTMRVRRRLAFGRPWRSAGPVASRTGHLQPQPVTQPRTCVVPVPAGQLHQLIWDRRLLGPVAAGISQGFRLCNSCAFAHRQTRQHGVTGDDEDCLSTHRYAQVSQMRQRTELRGGSRCVNSIPFGMRNEQIRLAEPARATAGPTPDRRHHANRDRPP